MPNNGLLKESERQFLLALSQLVYCNPFEPERLKLERQALGNTWQAEDLLAWSRDIRLQTSARESDRPNVILLTTKAEQVLETLFTRLQDGAKLDNQSNEQYRDLVSYVLYYRHVASWKIDETSFQNQASQSQKSSSKVTSIWRSFLQDYKRYLRIPDGKPSLSEEPAHLFACLFQVRRAFRFIFDNILGDSRPAIQLRAMVWQSVFTHDMRRFRRLLFDRMRGMTTLITGPSGTGKELVARAISLSQYIPFGPEQEQFAGGLSNAFLPVNLSALSPTLVESELFGHCRGAFTGALADRQGRLEICPAHGAVFLDEIGELDPALQVKLLRVVQEGTYSRIGESNERMFSGKLLAATNRDLGTEIHAGRFREDLYYRLCSDRIETPSLRDHLIDNPKALQGLIAFIARRLVGNEAEEFSTEVALWIRQNIADDYPWPGNIRELEQCVRNLLVRRHYQPRSLPLDASSQDPNKQWLADAEQGTLSFAELLSHYCTSVYAKLGSYQQTAEVLEIDRRTVRAKINPELLKQLRNKPRSPTQTNP